MPNEKSIGQKTENWLVLKYLPVSLFSLRMTHATSKGGKTLLVPTPYAFKMTMIDACFRVFGGNKAEIEARQVFDLIKGCEIRFSPPKHCIVQNTFIKIRQEERDAPKGFYVPTIAYREFCFYSGDVLKVAFKINSLSNNEVKLLINLGAHINCIGKRGSFWQFVESEILDCDIASSEYTVPQIEDQSNIAETGNHGWSHSLDDFGDKLCEAKDGFDRMSTYGEGRIELGKHRVLIDTLIPYKFQRASRNFTHFIRD